MPASERLFVAAGRLAARTPHFRGKTRALLELFKWLGLEQRHVQVRTTLRRPVRFEARLDLHSWLQRLAFLTGGYEDDTVEFLVRLYRLGGSEGSLLDIGANIGLISIPFVKATGAHAVAVEAVPDNVAALQENIALNGLSDSLNVFPFALGDTSGVARIQVEGNLDSGEGTGTANILPESYTDGIRQEIRIRTLDELLDSGELPARGCVVKIDTDGYDLKVLQGGPRFLAEHRPVIFGEFSSHCMAWHNQSLADVVTFASANGYDTWRRLLPEWRFTRSAMTTPFDQDLLLVPQERTQEFRSLLAS